MSRLVAVIVWRFLRTGGAGMLAMMDMTADEMAASAWVDFRGVSILSRTVGKTDRASSVRRSGQRT